MIQPRFRVVVTRLAAGPTGAVRESHTLGGERAAMNFIAEEVLWEHTLWAECEALGVRECGSFNASRFDPQGVPSAIGHSSSCATPDTDDTDGPGDDDETLPAELCAPACAA